MSFCSSTFRPGTLPIQGTKYSEVILWFMGYSLCPDSLLRNLHVISPWSCTKTLIGGYCCHYFYSWRNWDRERLINDQFPQLLQTEAEFRMRLYLSQYTHLSFPYIASYRYTTIYLLIPYQRSLRLSSMFYYNNIVIVNTLKITFYIFDKVFLKNWFL